MIINIVDRRTDAIVDFLESDTSDSPPFWDDSFYEKVENGAMYFDFATHSDISKHLINKNKLVIKHPDGYSMCFIIEDVEQTTEREIFVKSEAEHMRLRTKQYIEPQVREGETLNTALDFILDGTRWKRGITEFSGARKIEYKDFTNKLKAILDLENIFDDIEVRFRVEDNGHQIVGRYVDFYERIGYDGWRRGCSREKLSRDHSQRSLF